MPPVSWISSTDYPPFLTPIMFGPSPVAHRQSESVDRVNLAHGTLRVGGEVFTGLSDELGRLNLGRVKRLQRGRARPNVERLNHRENLHARLLRLRLTEPSGFHGEFRTHRALEGHSRVTVNATERLKPMSSPQHR